MKLLVLTKVLAFSASFIISGATFAGVTVDANPAISVEVSSELVGGLDAKGDVESLNPSIVSSCLSVDALEDIWYR